MKGGNVMLSVTVKVEWCGEFVLPPNNFRIVIKIGQYGFISGIMSEEEANRIAKEIKEGLGLK